MRLLLVGLVLMAAGIGYTEYARRNPSEADSKKDKDKPKEKETPKPPPGPPPTIAALIETEPVGADAPGDGTPFEKDLTPPKPGAAEAGFTTVFSAAVKLRELRAQAGVAVAVIDRDGKSALVRLSATEKPALLAARAATVSVVALDGPTVWWAEKGRLFSMPVDGSAEPAPKLSLPKAMVLGLAVKGDAAAVLVGPRDADPFSTDESGALIKLSPGGAVTLVAQKLVRPHDVMLEKGEAFWIAGYPSGLHRAALDGSFSSRIAERADGPLVFDGEGVVHRVPVSSGSELRRVARAGGGSVSLAHIDAALVTTSKGLVYFIATGITPRLYSTKAGEEAQELLALKGEVVGLAAADGLWVSVTDSGQSTVRYKP